MKDTVISLLEFAAKPEFDFVSKNTAAYNILRPVTESEMMTTQYVPQKVMVLRDGDKYVVEYANNLERLMLDQDMGIVEAMEVVAAINNICVDECTVVFDESCIEKIDIEAVIRLDPDFDLAKK